MNEHTGQIFNPAEVAKLDAAVRKHLIEIPDKDLAAVQHMNRHQRRAWAVQQRKALKAAAK